MLRSTLKCFGLSGRVEPDSAHDGDQSRRAWHPKWWDISIPLPLDCLFFQYSCSPSEHKLGSKLTSWSATMVCRWNLGTRPPIRINDISSWTYDKNTFFVNPARYERQWNKSNVDFTIINKLWGWICWYNEINSSRDILGCCVFWKWHSWCKHQTSHPSFPWQMSDSLDC